MPRFAFCLPPLLCLTLAACGAGNNRLHAGDYIGGPVRIECAPFARALTGVRLSGAAADWWQEAGGRYGRMHTPEIGSVMVFQRSSRLPFGHVAVVSQLISRRQILVTQANWVHHRVSQDQPVVDVSETGDWSEVRVWWPPTGQIGSGIYLTYGFIQPHRPLSRSYLADATPSAIRSAEGAW